MKVPRSVRRFLKQIASKGGDARAKALTPERRSEIAKKAVACREARKNGLEQG